jgi:putative colanic acid biosynthesis UDP-glucose lipid carrier transferase
MNFVKQPIGVDLSDGGSAHGLDEQPRGGRKWPIHYDSVEPLAIVADFAGIVLASVFSGLSYHLQQSGTLGDIGKSLGSAILVSALFISLMKIRGMYRPTELMVLRSQIRAVCLTWTSVFLLLGGTVFALKIGNEISRGTSMLFAMLGLKALLRSQHRSDYRPYGRCRPHSISYRLRLLREEELFLSTSEFSLPSLGKSRRRSDRVHSRL